MLLLLIKGVDILGIVDLLEQGIKKLKVLKHGHELVVGKVLEFKIFLADVVDDDAVDLGLLEIRFQVVLDIH